MFLLFEYDDYYPQGPSIDFVCKYKTFKECFEQALKCTHENTDIYNVLTDEWYRIFKCDRWFTNGDTKGQLLTNEFIQELFDKFEK